MTRCVIRRLLGACIMTTALSAFADEGRRLPMIGHAVPIDEATDAPYSAALRDGLRQLGYVDGENIIIVVRYANGDREKLRANLRELIGLGVDVIVSDAPAATQATTSIPIVSPTMSDPVKTGLVASLARPAGNLTGLSAQSYDIWPKQLELARELIPNLRRISFLFDTKEEPEALASANRSAGATLQRCHSDSRACACAP